MIYKIIIITFMSCIAYSQQFDTVFFDELSRSNLKNALVRLNSFLKIPNASRDLINIQKNEKTRKGLGRRLAICRILGGFGGDDAVPH